MPVSLGDSELKYWYFVLPVGGVESGDTSMEMPAKARVVETLEEMTIAIDVNVDRQRELFDDAQQSALDAVEDELGDLFDGEDGEEGEDGEDGEGVKGTPIRHSDFKGMGSNIKSDFADKGVTTVEQLFRLGPKGIVDLGIDRVGFSLATVWYKRAIRIIEGS